MPYIKKARRYELTPLVADDLLNSGELNYVITKICNDYIGDHGNKLSYALVNDIIGTLECVKQEFYRRIAVPYEDNKIAENGDVY